MQKNTNLVDEGIMEERVRFLEALRECSLPKLQAIAKSDLHNHAGRGGSLEDVEEYAGVKIEPPREPFDSLDGMNAWLRDNVKPHCPPGIANYLFRVKLAFQQAARDNIRVLALDYAVDEILALGGMDAFIRQMEEFRRSVAPGTRLIPDLTIYNRVEEETLQGILSSGWFHAIDFINYSGVLPMEEMKRISCLAKNNGLRVKAHVGEFGSAEEIARYLDELELDEIQHGVQAVRSEALMRRLADARIPLHVCPTSNVMLGVCRDYASHPIRKLYDHGVRVTINTDDLLIFHSSVSEEYLHLYSCGLMRAEELADIRENGLAEVTE